MASLEAENRSGPAFRVCLKMRGLLPTQGGAESSSAVIEKLGRVQMCVCVSMVWKCNDCQTL